MWSLALSAAHRQEFHSTTAKVDQITHVSVHSKVRNFAGMQSFCYCHISHHENIKTEKIKGHISAKISVTMNIIM